MAEKPFTKAGATYLEALTNWLQDTRLMSEAVYRLFKDYEHDGKIAFSEALRRSKGCSGAVHLRRSGTPHWRRPRIKHPTFDSPAGVCGIGAVVGRSNRVPDDSRADSSNVRVLAAGPNASKSRAVLGPRHHTRDDGDHARDAAPVCLLSAGRVFLDRNVQGQLAGHDLRHR